MSLPRDAAPAASDRGTERAGRPAAQDPGHHARPRRPALRPARAGGGAGARVPGPGRGTGAPAVPAAASPGAAVIAAGTSAGMPRAALAGVERVRVPPLPGRPAGITRTLPGRRAAAERSGGVR